MSAAVHAPARAPFERLRAESEERDLQRQRRASAPSMAMSPVYAERQRLRDALNKQAQRNWRRGYAAGLRHAHVSTWAWGFICGGIVGAVATGLLVIAFARLGAVL